MTVPAANLTLPAHRPGQLPGFAVALLIAITLSAGGGLTAADWATPFKLDTPGLRVIATAPALRQVRQSQHQQDRPLPAAVHLSNFRATAVPPARTLSPPPAPLRVDHGLLAVHTGLPPPSHRA